MNFSMNIHTTTIRLIDIYSEKNKNIYEFG